jgi:hypothetical protein
MPSNGKFARAFRGRVQSEGEEIKQRKGKEGWMDEVPPVPFKPTIFTASLSLSPPLSPLLWRPFFVLQVVVWRKSLEPPLSPKVGV